MCRMIFARGKFDTDTLIDDMIIMALDKNERHEENAKQQFRHADGWGACYLQDGGLVVHKSVRAIFDDHKIDELRNLGTNLFILHTRRASQGSIDGKNVHPFVAEQNGQKYVFFHNGTIFEKLTFSKKFHPQGATDSEKYFFYLLGDSRHELNEVFLRQKLIRLNDFSGANFILTSGEKTFIANWYATNPRYYTMKKFSENSTTIVSSEILPHYREKNWQLPGKELATSEKP
ncbi:MAG: hypothetical protein GXO74_12180 [Calditrichaeota bacterium]|nr:hypothetical protein [Calditrichota bacterium]